MFDLWCTGMYVCMYVSMCEELVTLEKVSVGVFVFCVVCLCSISCLSVWGRYYLIFGSLWVSIDCLNRCNGRLGD